MSTQDFVERLAAATPTPGGGAAACRTGLHACSLLRMAMGITRNKLPQDQDSTAMERLAAMEREGIALSDTFRRLERQDMEAFDAYMEACRMPRDTAEQKMTRAASRTDAIRRATDAPLNLLDAACSLLSLAAELLDLGKTVQLRAQSDLFASVELLRAACRVAGLNIRVNLGYLPPEDTDGVLARWKVLQKRFQAGSEPLIARVPAVLGGPQDLP